MPPLVPSRRVALCITELDPGGAERAFMRLAIWLARHDWEVAVFCLGPRGPLAEPLEDAGIRVTCYGARSAWQATVVWPLTRELRRYRPAVLQTFLFHANIAGRLAGRLAGIPRIVSGIRVAERRASWRLRVDRLTSGLVDRHVCVSQAVADFSIQHGLSPDKIVVISNGVAAEEFAEAVPADLTECGIPAEAPTLLYVGRLDPQKGLLVLLHALEELHRGLLPDLHLLLVGAGPQRSELEAAVASRGLESVVHFAGWRPDVPQLMRAADCLVLPSLWEGMPNVVLEGLAADLPIVATRVEGVSELITPGKTGWLVTPGDTAELAHGIHQLITTDVSEGTYAVNARAVLAGRTWDKMGEQYAELYQSLLESS